jgi:hypothetical protein
MGLFMTQMFGQPLMSLQSESDGPASGPSGLPSGPWPPPNHAEKLLLAGNDPASGGCCSRV